LLLTTEDKDNSHNRINQLLVGPLLTMDNEEKVIVVDQRSGIIPPPWWRGDAQASRTGRAAMVEMRRTR